MELRLRERFGIRHSDVLVVPEVGERDEFKLFLLHGCSVVDLDIEFPLQRH
jgi:hypothetical protein